jgi:Fe(3+) dicitrate transport protein
VSSVSPSILARSISIISALLVAQSALSQESEQPVELQQVFITGGANEIQTQPGSATLIDETALEQFEYTDIHRVLNEVPGINLQEEDGYGLRPNIGMRGSSPERSKKVTIMEDGILSGPAPYSAPAAYYFPNVSRMSAVEVFKGPSAIQYGPATVAGAVNMVSRAIPFSPQGELDVQAGSYEFKRLNAYYGEQVGNFGYVVEGLHASTTGFKDLDGTEYDDLGTGFERNDFSLKTSYDLNGEYRQRLTLKLGYADEQSNETYVGLSKADFDADPYRRYAASVLDNMQWEHTQLQLTHTFEPTITSSVTTDIYRNEFSRDWFKLNSFGTGSSVTIDDVLQNPAGNNSDYYQILTGERNTGAPFEALLIGNNGRDFISQGIQTKLNADAFVFGLSHQVEVGVRLHMDEIKRNHTQQSYDMTATGLQITADSDLKTTKVNKGEATALALYIKDDIQINDSTISLGLRSETIETTLTDTTTATTSIKEGTESVLVPGAGIFTQLTEHFGILAGVHKGYVATAPGQVGDIEPEESINYEVGFRMNGQYNIEVVAYLNDYSNLKGVCSFNNGCDSTNTDTEFNGGEVLVYGLESHLKFEQTLTSALSLPLSVTYTFTQTEFQNSFDDPNGIFAALDVDDPKVFEGDELAYVPAHRLNIKTGLQAEKWQLMLSALYQGEMRSHAGQGTISDEDKIDAYVVMDLAANYQVLPELQIYSTVDNLLGKEYLVAAQPMGYRPGKPTAVHLGAKYRF